MKTKFWEWRKSLSADVMKNAVVHRGVLVCDCSLQFHFITNIKEKITATRS